MFRLNRMLSSLILLALVLSLGFTPLEAAPPNSTTSIFVDTDIGVDDAVAIAWLLKERSANIVGFSTVYGNSTAENATRNLLTLLATAQVQKPITIGANTPLVFPRFRTGALVHGPDGFWFAQQPFDISQLPTNAPAAIAAAARANPGLTILALGPLTNIAKAVQQYPADLAGVRLVALGGGTRGNITPVAEYNIYSDPHALEVVLASQMRIELVTVDAFQQVTVDEERFIRRLAQRGGTVGQLLAAILPPYFDILTPNERGEIAIADAAAAIYAVRPDLGTPTSALVRTITDSSYARGQTVIATTFNQRISLIADPEEISQIADQAFTPGFDLNAALLAILARQPDNAQVVLDVNGPAISRQLERVLTR